MLVVLAVLSDGGMYEQRQYQSDEASRFGRHGDNDRLFRRQF